MAANSITALNPAIWRDIVQDYLNKMLVGTQICNTKCEANLTKGSSVNFPYLSDMYVQDYAQGTDLTAPAMEATQSSLTVDQSKAAVFIMDPVQERQAAADYGVKAAYQSAFQLKNNIDQKIINTGISNASSLNTITGGSLSSSNILTKLTDSYAALAAQNAVDGEMFCVVDPRRQALMTQSFIANGFQLADSTLRNQFAGKAVGFDVYVSNNLPYSVTLTVDTQPSNTDTFTIGGVTWTCVTDGTAATAGQINIGANLADFQAIFKTAINGTTPPSANDYIDVSTENRRKYQNNQVTSGTFAANAVTITSFGPINGTETFTAATNIFGTETVSLLAGRKGAISLAIQMAPELYIREEPLQLARNYITHTLFGTAVFTRDAYRLSKITANH